MKAFASNKIASLLSHSYSYDNEVSHPSHDHDHKSSFPMIRCPRVVINLTELHAHMILVAEYKLDINKLALAGEMEELWVYI